MNKKYIEQKLNEYGSSSEPFFFIISYDFSKFFIEKLSSLPSSIRYEINNKQTNKLNHKSNIKKYPISFYEYKKRFDILQEHIRNGNSYLLNLTAKTHIKSDYTLDEIYEKVNTLFKLRFKMHDNDFVCFSPERFVKIENNKINTYPMKGTISSHITNAKTKLLTNKKEMAEHTMIVDLLRNDLGINSKNIKVEEFRYLNKINAGDKELFQVSSKVSAQVAQNWKNTIGTILTSMLPAGSITGAPKKKTIEILKEVENYNRDFYTGIFGVYDGESLDSAVMIRFIEKNKDKLYYKSGGGITCDSIAKLEYQELIDKIYLPF